MLKWIRQWYNGKTTMLEFENDPNSRVVVLPAWITTYHWTARIARSLVKFYLQNWQFVWGTAIGLIGVIIGLLSLK